MENALEGRLKAKYPMLEYLTDRTFGVEIEFYGLTYTYAPIDSGIVKKYCIGKNPTEGKKIEEAYKRHKIDLGNDTDHWHLEPDTSVRGKAHTKSGAELVSPIMRGIDGLVETYSAFQFLNDVECIKIDKSCGFHVHHGIDKEKYRCRELLRLVEIVNPIENFIYLYIPGRRENDTCAPIEIDIKRFMENCGGECEKCKLDIKELWDSQVEKNSNSGGKYDPTRYHGLNLYSYWHRGTIEFRYHSGVLDDIDEAMQWIIFTQFLMELSAGNIPEVRMHRRTNKWLDLIYQLYWNIGEQDKLIAVS